MRYSALLACIIFCQISIAQTNSIEGNVSDKTDQQALEFAIISLYNQSDSSLINGALTDSKGTFIIKKVPSGQYYLEVKFMGYESRTLSDLSLSETLLDLGNIELSATQLLLNEVEISGRKISSFHTADKQVFAAAQFRNAQGGSATDVLRNLPSLSVDALGEISVRGTSGFMVMLNGKQVETDPVVILNQLPANAIERIEIITTPSASYDPDGKAGIINITTKKGAVDGFYVMANFQIWSSKH